MQAGSLFRGDELRRNIIANPSFEVDTSGAVGTRCTISSSADRAWTGACSLKAVALGTGATFIAWAQIPATAGTVYTSTFRVYALSGIGYVNHNLAFYNSAGTLISPEYNTGYGQISQGAWVAREHQATAPSGTATMRVLINLRDASNANPAAGATAYIDGLYLGPAGDYFDGSTSSPGRVNEWAGEPHQSVSTQYEALSEDVRSYRSRILVNGVERTHLSWDLGRDLSGDLPEQVVSGAGITQASGNIVWGTYDDVTGVVHPWNPSSGWVPAEGDRVQIFVAHGSMEWQQFEGVIDDAGGDASSYGITSKIVDRIDDFSRKVNLPAIVGTMPPTTPTGAFRRVGIMPRFHLMMAMRRAGYYVTPPAEFGTVLSVPSVGSLWPLLGECTSCNATSNSALAPTQVGVFTSDVTANYAPTVARAVGTTTQITLCTNGTNTGTQTVTLYYGSNTVTLRVAGTNVSVRINGTIIITQSTSNATIYQVLLKGGQATLRTNKGLNVSAAFDTGSGAQEMTRIQIYGDANARLHGVMVSHPTQAVHEFASVNFTPSARVDTGAMHDALAASLSTKDTTCAEHLDAIGQALLIPFWIDETGKAQAVQSDVLRARPYVRVLTTKDDVTSFAWTRNLLGARSQVSATYDAMTVNLRRDYSLEVWSSSEAVSLGSGEDHFEFAETPDDEAWIMVDESLTIPGRDTLADANKGIGSISGGIYTDGVNEDWATLPSGPVLTVSLSKMNEGTWRFKHATGTLAAGKQVELRTWSSTYTGRTELWPYWWDKELPRLRAKALVKRVQKTREPSIIGSRGPELVHDCGPWATGHLESNETTVVDQLIDFISGQVIDPQPVIEGLGIIADPRLQLGDVVLLRSEKLLGVELRCLIVGIDTSFSADGLRQRLSVRVISHARVSITYDEWTREGSAQTYDQFTGLPAQTYDQFTTTLEG